VAYRSVAKCIFVRPKLEAATQELCSLNGQGQNIICRALEICKKVSTEAEDIAVIGYHATAGEDTAN
jgi:hypothetical protein